MNKYRISYSFKDKNGKNLRRANYDVEAETEEIAMKYLQYECECKGRVFVKHNSTEILKRR